MKVAELTALEGPFIGETSISSVQLTEEASESNVISFFSEVPAPLRAAMKTFIERHPKGINTD